MQITHVYNMFNLKFVIKEQLMFPKILKMSATRKLNEALQLNNKTFYNLHNFPMHEIIPT
jgi:hypothetical protein